VGGARKGGKSDHCLYHARRPDPPQQGHTLPPSLPPSLPRHLCFFMVQECVLTLQTRSGAGSRVLWGRAPEGGEGGCRARKRAKRKSNRVRVRETKAYLSQAGIDEDRHAAGGRVGRDREVVKVSSIPTRGGGGSRGWPRRAVDGAECGKVLKIKKERDEKGGARRDCVGCLAFSLPALHARPPFPSRFLSHAAPAQ